MFFSHIRWQEPKLIWASDLCRPLSWSSVYGADPQSNAAHRCTRSRSAVRPAVGRSRQRRPGLGRKRPWCLLHVWGRCGGQIFTQTWHGPNMQGTSGTYVGGLLALLTEVLCVCSVKATWCNFYFLFLHFVTRVDQMWSTVSVFSCKQIKRCIEILLEQPDWDAVIEIWLVSHFNPPPNVQTHYNQSV